MRSLNISWRWAEADEHIMESDTNSSATRNPIVPFRLVYIILFSFFG